MNDNVSIGISNYVGLHAHGVFSLVYARQSQLYHEVGKGVRVGKIILLNTPIGNLGDITSRVLEAFKEGTLFAAEDTRVLKELFNHLRIGLSGKRILAMHEHSTPEELNKLLELVLTQDLYVTSDAGSPIISDPAFPLVAEAHKKGIKVESYSGVSSPIMALELSGLPPIPFQFHGFLPREKAKKERVFSELLKGTHIFFEAPPRVEETLDELAKTHREFRVALLRELSKKFEQVLRFEAGDWPEVKGQVVFKGEFVLVIHREDSIGVGNQELKALAEEIMSHGAGPKQVAKLLALILDLPTKEIYAKLNRQK